MRTSSNEQSDALSELFGTVSDTFLSLTYPLIVEQPYWIGHVPFAWWLTSSLNPRVLVELGTYTGVSYSALLAGMFEHAEPGQAFCVDSWAGDAHTGSFGEVVFQRFSHFHKIHYSSFSQILRMQFEQACQHIPDTSIDLLHIDGCHTYDAAKRDFEVWLPKLSSNAVVLFHDIISRKDDFGVWKLWSELTQHYPSFSFTHSQGLGVLAVG